MEDYLDCIHGGSVELEWDEWFTVVYNLVELNVIKPTQPERGPVE
jgi:hypothetical protein